MDSSEITNSFMRAALKDERAEVADIYREAVRRWPHIRREDHDRVLVWARMRYLLDEVWQRAIQTDLIERAGPESNKTKITPWLRELRELVMLADRLERQIQELPGGRRAGADGKPRAAVSDSLRQLREVSAGA